MTDCELLEMAAKAAGIVGEYHEMGEGMRIEENPGHDWWNPLTDDGDALRLAHALGMQLNLEDCNDINDARTEIVMAAAAIGSAM